MVLEEVLVVPVFSLKWTQECHIQEASCGALEGHSSLP